jgi:PmbA protein
MEKEFLKEKQHTITLNVTAGQIDSYRELEKTTGTVRVYENGCIGIAGCLGEPDEEALTAQAREALSHGIPYPCDLEGAAEITELRDGEIIPVSELIPAMKDFLERLGAQCPKMAFSNKISLEYGRTEYRNSLGRHLLSSGGSLSIELLAQNRGSGNLFDMFFGWQGEHFDPEMILAQFKRQYDAFYTPADIEPGRWPVVARPKSLYGTTLQHFIGDLYAAGASLLSGKLGKKIFSEKLTFCDDMNPDTCFETCFFDAEGCVAKDYRPLLVENGELKSLLTTKKTASQYGLPNSGTASAPYDGVPSIGFHECFLAKTAETLGELVPGKAVLLTIASGGDTTPDGHFATPVQLAFLLEDGKLVGRLPEISIGGNFFDMLGKDYIGTAYDWPFKKDQLAAVMMDVNKS